MFEDYEQKKQRHRREVHTFIDNQLYPEIGARLSDVFPEYEFRRGSGGTWSSFYTIEGNRTKNGYTIYCTPTPGKPISIGGNGSNSGIGGTGITVLNLYKEKHQLSGTDEAAEEIANLLGVKGFPKWEGYTNGDSQATDAAEADKAKAAEAFTRALVEGSTPGAREAKAYLLSRFSEREYEIAIEKHLIGYADEATLAELERIAPKWHSKPLQSNIGAIHTIAVVTPYGTHPADSFNFRALPSQEEAAREAGKSKYDMPAGTKRDVLGGLPWGAISVVVVEGEIDRLKASLAFDVENETRAREGKPLLKQRITVVSAGTNNVSEEKAKNAVARGVKRFTIIPDSDKPKEIKDPLTGETRVQFNHELPGTSGTLQSINRLYEAGAEEVYIAPLPTATDEAGNTVKVDTADYIKAYGVEAWYKAIEGAREAALPYKARVKLTKHIEEALYYGVDEEKRDTLVKDLESLIYSPYASYDTAEKVYAVIREYLEAAPENKDYFRLDLNAFKAYVNGRKQRQEAEQKAATLKYDIEEAYKRSSAGDIAGAVTLITESAKKNTVTAASDYAELYALPSTDEEIENSFRDVVPGVKTGLYVTAGTETNEVTFKEGVSLVVGARKHGKTTFLSNLVLNEATKNLEEKKKDYTAPLKKVIFITYEVRKNRLTRDLLAIYLKKRYGFNLFEVNKKTISAYYDRGVSFQGVASKQFHEGSAEFFRDYIRSGAITIIDLTGRKDVEEVVAVLTQFLSSTQAEGGVSLVALDYIQKLTTREKAKAVRTEALKYIGEVLADFAISNKLPVVCAAQFNRITNLLQVDTSNIGEAGDLERIAVDTLGIFNLKELRPLQGSDYTQGFGLHKSIFRKFGMLESDYIEEVPTGDMVKATKDTPAHEKMKPNLKPLRGKIYISLLASRYDEAPAEVIADFVGSCGYVDIPKTKATAENCVARLTGNLPNTAPGSTAKPEGTKLEEEEERLPF